MTRSGGVCCSRRRCGAERKSSRSSEISGGTRRRHADFFPVSVVVVASRETGDGPQLCHLSSLHRAAAPRLLFTLPIYMNCASMSLFLSFFQGQLSAFSPQRALGRRCKIYLKGSFVLRAFCLPRRFRSPSAFFCFSVCVRACECVHIQQSQKKNSCRLIEMHRFTVGLVGPTPGLEMMAAASRSRPSFIIMFSFFSTLETLKELDSRHSHQNSRTPFLGNLPV